MLGLNQPRRLDLDQGVTGSQPLQLQTRFSSQELAEHSRAVLDLEFANQALDLNLDHHAEPDQFPPLEEPPFVAVNDSDASEQRSEVDTESPTAPEIVASAKHTRSIKQKYGRLLRGATVSISSSLESSNIARARTRWDSVRPPDESSPGARFFDISAEGNLFCYVVDSSSSMDEEASIDVARNELIASLEQLRGTQRFQVLFYDSELHPLMNGRQQTFSATTAHKKFARQFILSQQTSGGTVHKPALLAALKLAPDVIYFLTDGETPELSARDLRQLQQMNRQLTRIHVIEFGSGPRPDSLNWLEQLARDHRGSYRFQDVSR